MSERSIRVNELILRELSHILRTRYREQTVTITLTEVSVSPDLRNGRVFYSVIGDERAKIKARSFFTKEYRNLRELAARVIILKYFPKLNFVEDESIARGSRVLDILGSIDEQTALAAAAHEHGEDHDSDSTDADGYVEGPDYVFDEDDLEYSRDLEGGDYEDDEDADDYGEDEDGDEDLDDGEDDDLEEFDEENDVEFEGDLDDLVSPETAEGFGGDVIVDEPQIRLRSAFGSRKDKRDQDDASGWDDSDDDEDLDDGDDFDDDDLDDEDLDDDDGDEDNKAGK